MFISELEKKTGLTRHTIRFYEKEGFLENYIRRGENNYRDYSEDQEKSRIGPGSNLPRKYIGK